MSTPTIIGIIVAIALLGSTLAICLYLYSLKSKNPGNNTPENDEKSEQ